MKVSQLIARLICALRRHRFPLGRGGVVYCLRCGDRKDLDA